MFNGFAAEDGVELVRRIRQWVVLKIVGDGMNPVFDCTFYKPGRYVHAVDFVNLCQGPQDVAAGTTHIKNRAPRRHLRKNAPYYLNPPKKNIGNIPFMSCSLIGQQL